MTPQSPYRARQHRDAAFAAAQPYTSLDTLESGLDEAIADYTAARTPANRASVRRMARWVRGARWVLHNDVMALYARASGVPECRHCGHRTSHPCATLADSAVCMMMDGPAIAVAAE